jgi:hypothetical protein
MSTFKAEMLLPKAYWVATYRSIKNPDASPNHTHHHPVDDAKGNAEALLETKGISLKILIQANESYFLG